tara:strand:- start:537 stop:707 length:171 start_codon:yes stop_codon:yes gene_type:complete
MKDYKGQGSDFRLRKMANKLHEKFDDTWIDYLDGNATYDEWDKSLEDWLNLETLNK